MTSSRRRLPLIALVALLAAVACGHASAQPPAPSGTVGTRIDRALPSSLLRLPLEDAAGRRTSLAAYAGKVLVVDAAMTLCQETCPLDTANLVATARRVDRAGLAGRVEFVSITVDPERDTVPQLAAYRRLFAPPPGNWAPLTGSPAVVNRLWDFLGVYRKRVAEGTPPAHNWRTGQTLHYDVQHSDDVFFLNGDGRLRFLIDGPGNVRPGTPVPASLRKFLNGDGHRHLAHPSAGSWTVPQALQVVSWLTGRKVAS
ncbi:MAG: SCO family protein [Streptosporangiales bacterium]|nr:SCO family protein [Streptosporangiales bacterium]MBO0890828.1 SCO family protein [Acidothermales bacterium]